MTADDTRAAYIEGLLQLAGALEEHEEIQLPSDGLTLPLGFTFWGDDARGRLAATARALPCPSWDKTVSESFMRMAGKLAGLKVELVAERDAVCTRVVTGTEEREVEKVITPAVVEKVTETVDVVTWDCQPVLAPREVAHG